MKISLVEKGLLTQHGHLLQHFLSVMLATPGGLPATPAVKAWITMVESVPLLTPAAFFRDHPTHSAALFDMLLTEGGSLIEQTREQIRLGLFEQNRGLMEYLARHGAGDN